MAKKGAHSSGGGYGRRKSKDQAMAARLPPAPARWRAHPENWPYHNNLGTDHKAKKGRRNSGP
jgi:hypothetical protein